VKRRQFITFIGGAAAWPFAARAQQPSGVRRIGVLMDLAENDPEGQARIAAFLQGLAQLGWTDGRNVRIDTRWSAGDADRIRRQAAPEQTARRADGQARRAYVHSGPTRWRCNWCRSFHGAVRCESAFGRR
jgi:hypothetical protein